MSDSQNQMATDPRMETPGKSDEQWVADAVRNARPRKRRGPQARWVAVMDVFGCGSSYAHALCRRFGFNPDERVPS